MTRDAVRGASKELSAFSIWQAPALEKEKVKTRPRRCSESESSPRGVSPAQSEKPMRTKRDDEALDELRPEYDLAELLKHGVQGKYAKRCQKGTNLVLLGPDVARAFPTEEAVNEALRLVIKLAKVPGRRKRPLANTRDLKRSV